MNPKLNISALALAMLCAQSAWSATLEEITVTAQFKEASLQDTGIAMDAVSSDSMTKSGVTSAAELADMIPALTITNGGGISSQLYMRGVGNTANTNYLDPAIILTYDGVPIARGSAAAIGGFYDLERVEVLKGPQGTLYGKNATGGVLSIIPAKPKIGEMSGHIGGYIGNYDATQFTGAVNLPLGDNSALRLATSITKRDGYNTDGTNDDDRKSFRAQFLTEISDDLSIRLAADTTDIGGIGSGGSPIGRYVDPTGPAVYSDYQLLLDGVDPGVGMDTDEGNAYRVALGLTPVQDEWFTDARLSGFSAEINYNTDAGLLTIIPAWRKAVQESKFSGPGFNSGWWDTDTVQKTLEARFQGESESLDYLFGAFYFDEESNGDNTFNQEVVLPLQDYTQNSDSWAAFTQLTWKLGESSRLITGARYTEDNKEMNGFIDNFIVGPNPLRFPTLDTPEEAFQFIEDSGYTHMGPPAPGNIAYIHAENNSDYSSSKVTWRVSYEQDILTDSLFYASFETGYRTGGLEPTGGRYDPEFLDAYTIGMKNRLLDGSLQINAELFYWDYTDQQISYFTVGATGALENSTQNVGAATNQGVDVDVIWAAADNTLISGKLQYLDNSYDDLHFTTAFNRENINCPYTDTGTVVMGGPTAGNAVLDFDCSGNQSVFSPDLTVQLGIEQTVPMNAVNLILSLNTSWVDDQVTGFQNLPHEVIEDHWTTNIDVTLESADQTWSVSAYARNLEDERRVQSTQSPLLGMAIASYGPDMTYGMRLNYKF